MANAIRVLAMDAVEKANSGHPGMPMGMADVATALFTKVLKFDPAAPNWPDRDRFVLSAGHGSMLIYALLYLTGYEKPTLEDIKNFRQLGSPCAGHPENTHLAGVEVTTGPLGQGLAMAVGLALAERHLNATFGDNLVDHHTYVMAGDGCLMEGVSQEAISLAGHLGLSRLIVMWDDNKISIDGPTSLSTSEDIAKRFEAAGWDVQAVDGFDQDGVTAALLAAKASSKPSLIACRTIIGYGAPNKQGTEKVHGAALGKDEVAAARIQMGWDAPAFEVPPDIKAAWITAGARGKTEHEAWTARHAAHSKRVEFDQRLTGDLPAAVDTAIAHYIDGVLASPDTIGSRKSSENVLQVITAAAPQIIGGSADLTGSNYTRTKAQVPLSRDHYAGTYMHYGIREFGMAAAMNGLALHGGIVTYGGTFLVFADYCRPAIRLSAIQHARVIYVMTHDSIGVGEDGPTHQPIEHLASLRAMPNCLVFRPCDSVETAECWQLALAHKTGPSVIALSRQNLKQLRLLATPDNLSARGAYVLSENPDARVSLIATGSETMLAMAVQDVLRTKAIHADVISMPCCELFDAQPRGYRTSVLRLDRLKVAIEAASPYGWHKYVGSGGLVFGIDHFGASAPAPKLYEEFGLTADTIANTISATL